MEFSSRGFQRSTPPAPGASPSPQSSSPIHKKAAQKLKESKSLAILWVVFFGAITVLVIALILSISTKSGEASLVQKDQYQAIFLNNGQAYFGKVKTLNSNYIDLRDVYYLYNGSSDAQNQTAANLSLVKLGTELHCPKDQMVIYRDQISFWENLNSDGKVATAIKDYKDQGKDTKCSTSTQQTTQQSTSPQQTSEDTPSNTKNDSSTGTDTNSSSNNTSTGTGSTNGNL